MNFAQVKSDVKQRLVQATDQDVASYKFLRTLIGILGLSLPWLVWLVAVLLFHQHRQPSISAFYYTGSRDELVGTLCAIALVLASHKGPELRDWLTSLLAGVFAIGIALFPTTPISPTPRQELIGNLHYAFAAIFFLNITMMVLFLFTKGDTADRWKRRRNLVYRVCGLIMLGSVAALAVQAGLSEEAKLAWKASGWTFILETAAIQAFGVAWLLKGWSG